MSDEPIDVHQHLWPPALIEALRARSEPPMLRGWTLHLTGEPPYEVNPADHDVKARAARLSTTPAPSPASRATSTPGPTPTSGITPTSGPTPARIKPGSDPLSGSEPGPIARGLALVSLSSPLGLEDLPADTAAPLLDAWHDGCQALPPAFGAWAATGRLEPDLDDLAARLKHGFAGLQVPATWLLTPAALERLTPVLAVAEQHDKPVLVHPGAASGDQAEPTWWPAVVDYVGQLQAAWWSWHEAGRANLPTLRIGFVAGAGLAPLHHERLVARGGRTGAVDGNVFVETSSYGPQAVDALVRALGIDPIVRGSDYPYAEPAAFGFGSAADAAIDIRNPRRFLFGGVP